MNENRDDVDGRRTQSDFSKSFIIIIHCHPKSQREVNNSVCESGTPPADLPNKSYIVSKHTHTQTHFFQEIGDV